MDGLPKAAPGVPQLSKESERAGRQQRNLFRKYRSQREKSIAEIVASLEDLKDDFE